MDSRDEEHIIWPPIEWIAVDISASVLESVVCRFHTMSMVKLSNGNRHCKTLKAILSRKWLIPDVKGVS
jgi:hypothetical protein